MIRNKYMKFGTISKENKEDLEWILLDEDEKSYLLISLWSCGNDNSEYVKNFFKNREMDKFFNDKELADLEEVRLLTKEEYEKYKKTVDLKAPFSYFLALNKAEGDKEYYSVVSRINAKSMTEVVNCFDETFDIVCYYENGKFQKATYDKDKDYKDAQWNYAIRPVIKINK